MKPTKQTVYLPVSGDHDKVVCEDYNDWMDRITGVKEVERYVFTPEQLNQLLSDVIKDALNTAADKADWDCDKHHENITVDRQSITNTFEETFQKHKV